MENTHSQNHPLLTGYPANPIAAMLIANPVRKRPRSHTRARSSSSNGRTFLGSETV